MKTVNVYADPDVRFRNFPKYQPGTRLGTYLFKTLLDWAYEWEYPYVQGERVRLIGAPIDKTLGENVWEITGIPSAHAFALRVGINLFHNNTKIEVREVSLGELIKGVLMLGTLFDSAAALLTTAGLPQEALSPHLGSRKYSQMYSLVHLGGAGRGYENMDRIPLAVARAIYDHMLIDPQDFFTAEQIMKALIDTHVTQPSPKSKRIPPEIAP